MAEDDKFSSSSEPADVAKALEKPDAEVSKWIKNLAALVTVFAALAGIWVSAYQLRLKAEADKEAAVNNRIAEDDKLNLGKLQMEEQARSRVSQTLQHDKDISLELTRHQLDIQQARSALTDSDAKNEAERLSAVINHMFTGKESSAEGDLAALFEYIDRDATSREIVENVVLARLENPRSPEEIDMGFRVLEMIGPSALDATAQANRDARRRYDECLVSKYYAETARLRKIEVHPGDKDTIATGMGIALDVERVAKENVVANTTLDASYVFPTITDYVNRGTNPYFDVRPAETSMKCSQPLAAEIITRSTLALMVQFRLAALDRKAPGVSVVDLSKTYMTTDIFGAGEGVSLFGKNLDQAYIGMDKAWRPMIQANGGGKVPKIFLSAKSTMEPGSIGPGAGLFEPFSYCLLRMQNVMTNEKNSR